MPRQASRDIFLEHISIRLDKIDAAIAKLHKAKPAAAEPPRYLSVKAYSKSRDLSERQTRRLIAEGKLPAITIGHTIRIDVDAAEIEREYAAEHKPGQLNCGKADQTRQETGAV